MGTFLQDLRYGMRMHARNPGFTSVAVLTLALGIGICTTAFSVLNAAFVPHLQVRRLGRIALLLGTTRDQGELRFAVSIRDFSDWKEHNHVFEDMGLFSYSSLLLTRVGEPVRVSAQETSTGFFQVAGTKPIMGRTFLPQECQPGSNPVTILSYGLWQRTFGSDPHILGRSVELNRQSYIVIGVMPEDFSFPATKTDLWVPLTSNFNQDDRGRRFTQAIGVLKPGVTVSQAQAEMSTVAYQLERAYPATNGGRGVRVLLLRDDLNKRLNHGIIFLGGPVFFVLLIACANVANLLLSRGSGREKELSVRAALGAGRVRLVRQLLIESVPLAVIGGAIGLFLAWCGISLVRDLFSAALSLEPGALRMDVWLLVFSLLLSVLTPLLFGLLPAMLSTRTHFNEALKTGGIVGRASSGSGRLREWLVVVEMMLAIALLGMCGLFMSVWRWLGSTRPGFDPNNLLTMTISPPTPEFENAQSYYRRILERLKAVPGVDAVGFVDHLPTEVDDRSTTRPVYVEGGSCSLPQTSAAELSATPGYFEAMRIPLIRGRALSMADLSQHDSVALISETMARRCWPNQDPVGKRFRLGTQPADKSAIEVVGVVGDVMNADRARPPLPLVYQPLNSIADQDLAVVIRTPGSPISLARALKHAVWEVDKDQPLDDLRTMKEALLGQRLEYVRGSEITGTFAALALFLAAIGVYSVMSYFVAERTAEIGIRMALGASRSEVLRLVVCKGLMLALGGGLTGLAVTWALERLALSHFAELTTSIDIVALCVALLLLIVSVVASSIPALRATKVDPMVALRYE